MNRRDFIKMLPLAVLLPTVVFPEPPPFPLPTPPRDEKGLSNWKPIKMTGEYKGYALYTDPHWFTFDLKS